MVFLVESIEVGDLVLWWATRGPHMLISFLRPDRDLPAGTPSSTPDSQVIEGLSCRNAESPHLSNQTVSRRNARMNQAQWPDLPSCSQGSRAVRARVDTHLAQPTSLQHCCVSY